MGLWQYETTKHIEGKIEDKAEMNGGEIKENEQGQREVNNITNITNYSKRNKSNKQQT
jgi:hypothetical protein